MIPAVDLAWQHKVIEKDFNKRLEKLFTDFDFVLGKAVFEFEEKWAEFNKALYCISTSSGTSALELMVRALHLPPESEIIVQCNSFYATASAVKLSGVNVKFVDCGWDHLISIADIKKAITPNTKAVFVVHMFGLMQNMQAIKQFCEENKLILLEDAAHAHAAEYDGYSPGRFSLAAAYSHFPGKCLGSLAAGGSIITNNKEYAEELRKMRWFGCKDKNIHEILGTNSKMDTVEAIYLLEKLKHLKEWQEMREDVADRYKFNFRSTDFNESDGEIAGMRITQEFNKEYLKHALHQFVVQVPDRDKLIEKYKNDIGFNVHYPLTINKQKAFSDSLQRFEKFKCAEHYSKCMISLPIFPGMTNEQIDLVSEKVIEHVQEYT